MLGIKSIGSYLPDNKISNYLVKDKFDIDDTFIEDKIGVKEHTLKEPEEKASDLCVKAYNALKAKGETISTDLIDCCIVVTQNPDYNLPHTSAIVHHKLGLKLECACFDISLGCSGFVYGLSTILSFMKANNLKHGLLFTADPYSDIIDKEDKSTSMIFGDGAAVTYISENPVLEALDFSFGTNGDGFEDLICKEKLYMNGRAIFNFTAKNIPKSINNLLEKNNKTDEDIDQYILHQGSKYIVDTITKRLKVDPSKVPFDMINYGNVISSSIPVILEKNIEKNNTFLISGFGVGLSWGSAILIKK